MPCSSQHSRSVDNHFDKLLTLSINIALPRSFDFVEVGDGHLPELLFVTPRQAKRHLIDVQIRHLALIREMSIAALADGIHLYSSCLLNRESPREMLPSLGLRSLSPQLPRFPQHIVQLFVCVDFWLW